MHANASQLVLVLLLIGWKSGVNLVGQSCSVESTKPITFRHSNENRSKVSKRNNHPPFWICVWGESTRGYHVIIAMTLFRKAPFSKCFPCTLKCKAGVFKSLRFEESVWKASWGISVEGKPNRRNKAAFSYFSAPEWRGPGAGPGRNDVNDRWG